MKICKICNIEKNESEFYKDCPKRKYRECKECKIKLSTLNHTYREKCIICGFYYQKGRRNLHEKFKPHKQNLLKFEEKITI